MTGENLFAELSRGGYTLLVILGCSLLALFIAVERLVIMWRVVSDAHALGEQVAKNVLRGDFLAARAACERSRALVGDIFLAGFARYSQGSKESLGSAVERERALLLLKLKSHLWVLGTLGTIAPFVGLFGTVVGIRNAFTAMAAAGTGGFAVVANGISEALVATAAGIFVAVEAVVLYNYFQARLGQIAARIKLISEEFVELVKEKSPIAGLGLPATSQLQSAKSNDESGALHGNDQPA